MDVATMKPGLDFIKQLDEQVSKCNIVLAIIGPGWLNAVDEKGRRKLDLPRDHVRIELASALRREIPVIPVLVNGAAMPCQEDLPDELQSLPHRHALELRHSRFKADSEDVIRALRDLMPSRTRWRWMAGAAAGTRGFVPSRLYRNLARQRSSGQWRGGANKAGGQSFDGHANGTAGPRQRTNAEGRGHFSRRGNGAIDDGASPDTKCATGFTNRWRRPDCCCDRKRQIPRCGRALENPRWRRASHCQWAAARWLRSYFGRGFEQCCNEADL